MLILARVKTKVQSVTLTFTTQELIDSVGRFTDAALRLVAQFVISDIRQNIQGSSRRYSDPDSDGISSLNRAPELSESYKDYRSGEAYFRRFRGNTRATRLEGRDPNLVLSDKTSPRKRISNLTLTGELMESLTYEVSASRQEIRIFYEGYHSRAKMTNDELVSLLSEQDSRALGVTRQLMNRIIRSLQDEIGRRSSR